MDQKLIAWARAVKARSHRVHGGGGQFDPPPLWIFTDGQRLRDPAALLRRLPRGLCGVVLRPGVCDDMASRRAVLRICRERGFPVTAVEGPWRGHGRHIRLSTGDGFAVPNPAGRRRLTASAHSAAELRQAAIAGAWCVFLSPAFATNSHPGSPGLGACRWGLLAARSRVPVLALGGITGRSVRALPKRHLRGVGVIGAMADVARAPQCSVNAMKAV